MNQNQIGTIDHYSSFQEQIDAFKGEFGHLEYFYIGHLTSQSEDQTMEQKISKKLTFKFT